MSAWSRTEKPVITGIDSANVVFGVDASEASNTPGVVSPGWVLRKQVGSRVLYETLVAMKQPPSDAESGNDDIYFTE